MYTGKLSTYHCTTVSKDPLTGNPWNYFWAFKALLLRVSSKAHSQSLCCIQKDPTLGLTDLVKIIHHPVKTLKKRIENEIAKQPNQHCRSCHYSRKFQHSEGGPELHKNTKEAMYMRVNNLYPNKNIGKYHMSDIWDEVLFNTSELRIKLPPSYGYFICHMWQQHLPLAQHM